MTDDPDRELHHRLASEFAEAQLQVRACQEQVKHAAERLTDARAAMTAAMDCLNEARRLRDRVETIPWVWPDPAKDS